MKYFFLIAFAALHLGITPLPQTKSKIIFGVKVGLIHNSKLNAFALFRIQNGKVMGSKVLNQKELLKIGIGEWPYNEGSRPMNFFEDKNLGIYPVINQRTLKKEWYCDAFDSLWKIRFKEHPFSRENKVGWSNGKYKPSLKQQNYIYETYGVQNFEHEYFLDSSFYKIMRDVQDTMWIANYRALR